MGPNFRGIKQAANVMSIFFTLKKQYLVILKNLSPTIPAGCWVHRRVRQKKKTVVLCVGMVINEAK